MNNSSDDRSRLAVAMAWTSRITTIAMEMVLPGLLGTWADGRLGTDPLLLLLGVTFGFVLGMWSLLKLAKARSNDINSSQKDQENTPKR